MQRINEETELYPEDRKRYVFITVYKPKDTMYKGKIGKFSYQSRHGNKYKMITKAPGTRQRNISNIQNGNKGN